MSRAPLLPAAALLVAAILLGLQRPVPIGGGPFAFAVAAAAIIVALLAMAGVPFRAVVVAVLLAAAGVALGSAAVADAAGRCTAAIPADSTVAVEGVLESAAGGRLRIRLRAASAAGGRLRCGETVLARWNGAAPPVGERVAGIGRWWRPAGGGPRMAGVLMLDTVAAVAGRRGAGQGTGDPLARLRGAAARRLDGLYGDRAPLAASLLLAQRDGLDREVRDRFARAGLSHLLAISGLHVGLVAGLLMLLAKVARLPGGWPAALAALGTVAYVLFLGAPAAAARAALQVVLLLLAASLQRPARSEALVSAAAVVLLAADPASLLDPGFQLSFAGVAGLLALRRPLLRRLRPLAGWRVGGVAAGKWLADGLASGAAATLATAPIVAWHFGRVAPVGIVANLAAIPLVAMLVPALALSLAAAAIWLPAGAFLAGAGGLLLAALDSVATTAAAVPGGSMAVAPWTALLWTTAVVVACLATRRLGRVRPLVRVAAASALAAAVLVLSAVRLASDRIEIHVIDVGQGDAIAVRSPAGRWLLVDAGVAGAGFDAGERRVVPYLGIRGVRRLEALILTHPDADHIGGAAAVVRALRPRWVGDPGVHAGKPGYLELLEAAAGAGIPWVAVREGVELELDGATVEFLHPGSPGAAVADANDASVVLRVVYGEFSALLAGDAPAAVEAALIRRLGPGLEADVLKAGHHGSSTSTTPELLEATGATLALISAGSGNRYGHPHPAVLARLDAAGLRVLRTDRDGTIVVRGSAGGQIRVHTEREER
ncbi:MAG TPA: DNA internalization-related competence protein ComEC/Rec2 [Longimicrobiales bacterium]|nr:DNA internalization-related competence protein ComEC/Rec2 [Longimicrobiales bacterium]